jgi:hypothetical protein
LIAASASARDTPALNLTTRGTVASVDALALVWAATALSVWEELWGGAKAMDGAAEMKLKRSSRRTRVGQRGAGRRGPWSPIRWPTV